MDAGEEPVAAVRVGGGRRAALRSRRVDDDRPPPRPRPPRTRPPAPTVRRTAPNRSAVTAIVAAAMPMPSGVEVCRIPMASPRRCGGNHPITTRPLAALVLVEAAPARKRARPRRTGPPALAAATPRTAVATSPASRVSRSPRRSQSRPHATRVQAPPATGAAATRPASARLRSSRSTSDGIRKAGPVFMTADAAWAQGAGSEHRPATRRTDLGRSPHLHPPSPAPRGRRTGRVSWSGL